MNKAEQIKELRRLYSFKPIDIGDALAYVVSQYEGNEYIFTSVRTYSLDLNDDKAVASNVNYNLALVQKDFAETDFRVNSNEEIWKKLKIAFIFKNNDKNMDSTIPLATKDVCFRMFKNTEVSYLQDFIEILVSERLNGTTINKESSMALAQNYCAFMFGLLDENHKPKTYTFNYNRK